MDFKNFYEILGIREDATNREIRDAYLRKVKEWHPDVNHEKDLKKCHQMMCDINEAYRYLISPELRQLHDEVLAERREKAHKQATTKRQPENTTYPKINSKKEFNYYDIEDYDADEKEEFINWLNEYYMQVIKLFTGFITLEDIEKLVHGFESIINYEENLLIRKKRRYKNL